MHLPSAVENKTKIPPNVDIAPPIDMEILLSRCMGKMSFAHALLAELEISGSQQVEAIVLSVTSGENAQAAETAHSLKGAAATIGAQSLREKAAEIEVLGRSDETADMTPLAIELRAELNRCLEFISSMRKSS